MVAVKIIEHSADENSKIEGFRENLVCSNIQHPNVLITYKVRDNPMPCPSLGLGPPWGACPESCGPQVSCPQQQCALDACN